MWHFSFILRLHIRPALSSSPVSPSLVCEMYWTAPGTESTARITGGLGSMHSNLTAVCRLPAPRTHGQILDPSTKEVLTSATSFCFNKRLPKPRFQAGKEQTVMNIYHCFFLFKKLQQMGFVPKHQHSTFYPISSHRFKQFLKLYVSIFHLVCQKDLCLVWLRHCVLQSYMPDSPDKCFQNKNRLTVKSRWSSLDTAAYVK